MNAPLPVLREALGDRVAWLDEAITTATKDRSQLPLLFPQLPRRLSRDGLGGGLATVGAGRCDLAGWRRCDAGAAALLVAVQATDAELADLYAHGDLEERAMLLRSLAVLPITAGTAALLGEVQRTNMVLHVEAAVCDCDLLARAATTAPPGLGQQEANNLLLKLAFIGLPLARVFDGASLANERLSQMLQDLATEREAAGRAIWVDTDRLLCRAPVAGTIARVLGGLEHGDDGRRLAAAEALLQLDRDDLRPFAQERIDREPRQPVRALLQRVIG